MPLPWPVARPGREHHHTREQAALGSGRSAVLPPLLDQQISEASRLCHARYVQKGRTRPSQPRQVRGSRCKPTFTCRPGRRINVNKRLRERGGRTSLMSSPRAHTPHPHRERERGCVCERREEEEETEGGGTIKSVDISEPGLWGCPQIARLYHPAENVLLQIACAREASQTSHGLVLVSS